MKILQPVIWSKGTFLSPQHLQVQDRFLESVLQFRIEALRFAPWGFSRLEIDQEKLAGGAFAIHRATGLFPDGLAFEMPESDQTPPLKPLNEFFGPDQETIDVYLAVPNFRPSGINLSAPEGDVDTRFLATVATFRDENSGTSERAIQLARKNFRLLVEGEPRRGSVAIRVARVRRLESGTLQLDPHFAPPLFDFTASEYLISVARRLVEVAVGQERNAGWDAPAEESKPGRIHHRRHRQLLAAVHHQPTLSRSAPPAGDEAWTSRGAVLHHGLAGVHPDHLLSGTAAAGPARLRSRCAWRLLREAR